MRVETIALPPASPIGACSLEGLDKFDLIIVTGANGSGKTTLLSPLDAPGAATGSVGCIADTGARQMYVAQGVQKSITFVRSTQLLTGFRDLSQALGLATNTVRLQHEARLLRQLANHANAAEPAMAAMEPPQITALKGAFLVADGACADRPRTASEYNRLGTELARRLQGTWGHRDPGAAPMERLAAEAGVTPQHRNLEGLSEFSQVVAALPPAPAATNPPPSAAARFEAAALALAASIEEAVHELPVHERPNPQPPQADAAAKVVTAALQLAARAMQAALEARDALGQCRAVAARYLRAQRDRGVAVDACPVCANAIDASQVLPPGDPAQDQEAHEWRTREQRFKALARNLQTAAEALETTRLQAQQEHAAILTRFRDCADTTRNPVAQHAPSVRAARQALHRRCSDWQIQFGSTTPSSAAVTAAREGVADARQLLDALQAEEHALNGGLAQAQRDFAAFQQLGAALAARASLDAAQWHLALDEVQAASRRQSQRDRWIAVLTRMAAARQAEAETAQATLVQDAGMQARFDALVSRIHHPSVQTLRYQGREVMRAGVASQDALSEGQTALVNIAATIAVAGKVAGAPGHLPGWLAFDEPTNGLDEAARQQVAEYLGSMTMRDLPLQIFVATFDEEFAIQLQRTALNAGRRVRRVRLPPFRPGQPCGLTIEDPLAG
jgi:energy-coupling factor transporter ATP-binding protein EcfA2